MRTAGLDIGSRTCELVVTEHPGGVVRSERIDTTPHAAADCARLLGGRDFDALVVTGYGRALAEVEFDAESITEIKAHARGARELCPGCSTVLDVGGQDTKAIRLDGSGKVFRFEMNDRCAAGAGRFLEIMASALGYDLEDFGYAALSGSDNVLLSSMCAVFAESEVVGLVTRGEKPEDIARAVHRAIVRRIMAMLRRLSVEPPVVFAGGAARNVCLVAMLAEELGGNLFVPEDPEMTGALGAALMAAEIPGKTPSRSGPCGT